MDEALRAYGDAVGLGPLATDANGTCTLEFDGRLEVTLASDPDRARVVLWLVLGALPESGRAEAMEALLRANLFWRETGGATLSLMPQGGDVVMAAEWPLPGLDGQTLRVLVEGLVERSDALLPLLRGQPVAASPGALPPHGMILA
ncbi:MAG: type III secretion system chaperone [Dongiaceae bacterium]